jgi:hypothetical protein
MQKDDSVVIKIQKFLKNILLKFKRNYAWCYLKEIEKSDQCADLYVYLHVVLY